MVLIKQLKMRQVCGRKRERSNKSRDATQDLFLRRHHSSARHPHPTGLRCDFELLRLCHQMNRRERRNSEETLRWCSLPPAHGPVRFRRLARIITRHFRESAWNLMTRILNTTSSRFHLQKQRLLSILPTIWKGKQAENQCYDDDVSRWNTLNFARHPRPKPHFSLSNVFLRGEGIGSRLGKLMRNIYSKRKPSLISFFGDVVKLLLETLAMSFSGPDSLDDLFLCIYSHSHCIQHSLLSLCHFQSTNCHLRDEVLNSSNHYQSVFLFDTSASSSVS